LKAMADFQEAVSIGPHDANAQNNLGEALLVQGGIDEASPHILEALRGEPRSSGAHVNWATILNKRGRHDEAVAEYRAALQLQPDNAQAHCGLGVARLSRSSPRPSGYSPMIPKLTSIWEPLSRLKIE
jgi:Flp pilus assembly protein TadD